MAQSQSQQNLLEVGFPEKVPWIELWQIAGEIKEEDIQRCFAEAIWCLRAGGLHAAVIIGWLAITAYLQKVFALLPELIRDAYKARYAHRQPRLDDSDFLKICRQITLFGLRSEGETTQADQVLTGFLHLRNRCAHPPREDIDQKQVIAFLKNCGELFVTRTINEFRFGNWSVVRNLNRTA